LARGTDPSRFVSRKAAKDAKENFPEFKGTVLACLASWRETRNPGLVLSRKAAKRFDTLIVLSRVEGDAKKNDDMVGR
jgi:hypothetical protein